MHDFYSLTLFIPFTLVFLGCINAYWNNKLLLAVFSLVSYIFVWKFIYFEFTLDAFRSATAFLYPELAQNAFASVEDIITNSFSYSYTFRFYMSMFQDYLGFIYIGLCLGIVYLYKSKNIRIPKNDNSP